MIYSFNSPKLWNIVPDKIRSINDYGNYKRPEDIAFWCLSIYYNLLLTLTYDFCAQMPMIIHSWICTIEMSNSYAVNTLSDFFIFQGGVHESSLPVAPPV